MEYIEMIEKHINIILTIFGALFAWWTYQKNVKAEIIQNMAREVIAFYCVEQAAIKMLKEYMGDTAEQTIQRKLRENAMKNENNLESVRPTMSANSARKYL